MYNKIFGFYFICSLFLGSVHSFAQDDAGGQSGGEPINLEMRKSMFLHGTIPVRDAGGMLVGAFEVKYLPGAANILKDAKHEFKVALKEVSQYLQKEEFWEKGVFQQCKRGVCWGWEGNCKEGLGAIPGDFQSFKESFSSVNASEFGGAGRKCLDVVGFGAMCAYRAGTSAVYLSAGLVYSIVAPALMVAFPAMVSVVRAGVCGTVYPMMKMVWHAGAWTLTQVYTKTPPKKDSMIVSWVPAEPEIR